MINFNLTEQWAEKVDLQKHKDTMQVHLIWTKQHRAHTYEMYNITVKKSGSDT